jgi:hypothetical protein
MRQQGQNQQLMLTLFSIRAGVNASGLGTFCSRVEHGCFKDCFDAGTKKYITPPTTATLRVMPFGVDGCCTPSQDPQGGCTVGQCGKETCVNQATDGWKPMCPPPGATCPKCELALMSLDYCAEMCHGYGYAFSGVEYANQCYCGHFIPKFALDPGGLDATGATCQMGCGGCPDQTSPCDKCKCKANPSQWCGGGCAIAVSENVCSWGMPLIIVLFVGLGFYVGVGIGWAVRTKGSAVSAQSHPHMVIWREIYGMAMDGVDFSRSKLGLGPVGGGRGRDANNRLLQKPSKSSHGVTDSGAERKKSRKGEKEGSSGSGKSKGEKKQKKETKEKSSKVESVAAEVETASGGDSTGTKSTMSGGGGQWVHIPS